MSKKIVIDLRIYGPEFGGLGRYNQKLLENLIKQDNINQYIILVKKVQNIKLPNNFIFKVFNFHWYSFKEQIFLPLLLKKIKPDLVHFTHFNVPFFYSGKYIVTIHDLIMTKFPSKKTSTLNGLLFFIKRWGYNLIIKKAVKKADKIIAVSNFTAQDIKTYFKLKDSNKIKVIYEGLTKINKVAKDIELPKKFFLYIGNAYPHKNLKFLIKVFKRFLKKQPDYYLILVGKKDYFYKQLEKDINNNIILTDFVPDNLLPNYYQKAQAYIFPSLYEGFGLPPLEALAYQLPVLSSSATSLPEVLGEAVLYFDPQDAEELFNKLNTIIVNKELRAGLKKKGLEQIKKYSWKKMVKEIIKLYNN